MSSRLARQLARRHFPHAYVVEVTDRPVLTLEEVQQHFPRAQHPWLLADTGQPRPRLETVDVAFASTAIGLPPPRCILVISHRHRRVVGESRGVKSLQREQGL